MSAPAAEIDKLLMLAQVQDWKVLKGSGHYKFYPPENPDPEIDTSMVTVSATPGDMRAIRNIKANLKARGLLLSKDELKEHRKRRKALNKLLSNEYSPEVLQSLYKDQYSRDITEGQAKAIGELLANALLDDLKGQLPRCEKCRDFQVTDLFVQARHLVTCCGQYKPDEWQGCLALCDSNPEGTFCIEKSKKVGNFHYHKFSNPGKENFGINVASGLIKFAPAGTPLEEIIALSAEMCEWVSKGARGTDPVTALVESLNLEPDVDFEALAAYSTDLKSILRELTDAATHTGNILPLLTKNTDPTSVRFSERLLRLRDDLNACRDQVVKLRSEIRIECEHQEQQDKE